MSDDTRMARRTSRRKDGPGRRSRGQRPHPRRESSGGAVVKGLAALIGLLGVVALIAVIWGGGYYYVFQKPGSAITPGQPVHVVIARGSSTKTIGAALAEKGVIENANMFRWEVRKSGKADQLKAGEYELTTGMDYEDVIEALITGPIIDVVKVTIPEGFTIRQIAERVEYNTGIPSEQFRELASKRAADFDYPFLKDNKTGSLEGYLFPKTYSVKRDAKAADVINMMLTQFGKETSSLDFTYAKKHGLSIHQAVTLASMVEREAKLAKERPVVASVIYNRLARGMFLEIDATIQYALGQQQKRLLNSHLQIDSPYNTYKHKGLPPGPIANPGLASIQAALRPASTQFYFYVRTGADGSHTFTRTFDEFVNAKAKARR